MQQRLDILVVTDLKIGNYKNLYQAYRKGDYLLMFYVAFNMMDTSIKEAVKAFNKLNDSMIDVDKLAQPWQKAVNQQ